MRRIIEGLQGKAGEIVDDFSKAGCMLRELLSDQARFAEILDEQNDKIFELEESIRREMVVLPDDTNREVFSWEYEALKALAMDNDQDVAWFLGENIAVEDGSIIKANFHNFNLRDISTVAVLTGLQDLNLTVNKIRDVTALSGLVNLRKLNLSNNNIHDISPLGGLVNLSVLSVGTNLIDDIAVVSKLVNLEKLMIYFNNIRSLAPVSDLAKLEIIFFTDNPISESQKPLIQELRDQGVRVNE